MFKRIAEARVHAALGWSPVVATLGARQVGKTTLAPCRARRNPEPASRPAVQRIGGCQLARRLGADRRPRHLDHLIDSLMLRRLEPHHANRGKRLVKSRKVYVRDSGLLLYLLGIREVIAPTALAAILGAR